MLSVIPVQFLADEVEADKEDVAGDDEASNHETHLKIDRIETEARYLKIKMIKFT